ncbi:MAG: prepilin peptidase [Candidatus Izemoplasmataceae bacterium]
MILTLVVLYGLIFTSFFILLGTRIPKKESITGRSHCDKCNKTIPWYGLTPVLGWFFVRGKCPSCGAKVSIKYPVYELFGGLLFGLSYYILQDNLIEFMVTSIFFSLMIIVSVSDIEYHIVPDVVLIIFAPIIFILRMIYPLDTWFDALLGGVLAFSFLYLIAYYGKKKYGQDALGGGDIKLYFIIGLFLGAQLVFMSLFFAALLGIILGRSVLKKMNPIPFVPFIFGGVIITYFIGQDLLTWYSSLFIG